ncbi:tonsoku-like protein isoform X2 [Tribolium castaneum]|nr:PREDICTED: tonsoku-like protein isoform X2 [Tribolium castaneum]|eukprot:XP_008200216.1 PREDICTED: tonsoku-like protein isoform X2 [Tribolium castaneum]
MCARLYCNLGLVQDSLGNYDKALELFTKSINQCKAHDLYEQLQRGYMSLSSLLVKKGDSKAALQQCNLAAETAKKLRNKAVLLAGIFLSKSEILLKLGDLHGAKNALHKAYKLNTPDVKERKTIENNLKVVASMCYNQDKLLVTDSTDYPTLKKLYEKMGDGACHLKLYTKALDYYKKMMETAEKAEMTGPDLASCYYSLAETYKDNGQFEEAVEYFEKELVLCKNLKDSLNTLSNIADTKEAANEPISEVRAVYSRAIESCQREGNVHEEGRMLKRQILYLRRQKQHSEAFNLEQSLAKLDFHSSDSEGESSDAQTESVVGAEIDLEAITDVSDDSDVDQPTTHRRRSKNFQIKRNLKGETQLHTACIKGQLNVVRHLLDQGHPVNVRDNCGWLPLHEACIHGHLDVVQLLLDKGAAINDRGGTQCEGITPLHDAASNGHLPIVELLLTRGANAVAKTDEGETVLNFLRKWRTGVQLNNDSQVLYERLVEQISLALQKSGQAVIVNDDRETQRRSAIVEDSSNPDHRSDMETEAPSTSSLRRSAIIGLEDDDSSSPDRQADDYRNVMESLRRKNVKSPPKASSSVVKRPALLFDDDIVDDWLDDDLGQRSKKRKTASPVKSAPSQNCQYYQPPSRSPAKRPKQAKLTHFGHTRTLVEADSTSSPKAPEPAPKLPRPRSFDLGTDPTLSVDVRIEKKLYRVPVLLSQVATHTIKWLADEAAARYAKKQYIVPTLELETKNGAVLADDDPISLLFPMGGTQAEEVEARIVKSNLPPLIDRYKEACQDMGAVPRDSIGQVLQEFSVGLDLANRGFKGAVLAPLVKVLNRQSNLLELDLSGNFLTNECFDLLAKSLACLESLYKLNLNCTSLTSGHVQAIVANLNPDVSYKIIDLDFSDNWLRDESFESLALLTRRLQLKKFNLSNNKFTQNLFNHRLNKDLTLNLDQIEEFDISDNAFDNTTLITILSWLQFANLTHLNVSRNSLSDNFLHEVLNRMWTQTGPLRVCKLSNCHVTDSEVFDLLRVATSLQHLDVSYNDALTSISLRRLLQSGIITLDIYACGNIFQYFTEFSKYLDDASRDQNQGKTLKLSPPENSQRETEYLIEMWRELYGEKTVVELTSKFLGLSVLKV